MPLSTNVCLVRIKNKIHIKKNFIAKEREEEEEENSMSVEKKNLRLPEDPLYRSVLRLLDQDEIHEFMSKAETYVDDEKTRTITEIIFALDHFRKETNSDMINSHFQETWTWFESHDYDVLECVKLMILRLNITNWKLRVKLLYLLPLLCSTPNQPCLYPDCLCSDKWLDNVVRKDLKSLPLRKSQSPQTISLPAVLVVTEGKEHSRVDATPVEQCNQQLNMADVACNRSVPLENPQEITTFKGVTHV